MDALIKHIRARLEEDAPMINWTVKRHADPPEAIEVKWAVTVNGVRIGGNIFNLPEYVDIERIINRAAGSIVRQIVQWRLKQ